MLFLPDEKKQMKYIVLTLSIGLVISLGGCGTGKQLAQQTHIADSYYKAGNYIEALSLYSEIIDQYENNNNLTGCPVYTRAGESALKDNHPKLAINYLKKARNTSYTNASTYFLLAEGYKQIDNLSLEINTLSDYLKLYPDGKDAAIVKKRLFYTYVESENFDKALELWPEIYANNQSDTELLEGYFIANKGLDNTDKCNDIAEKLLGLDKDNITALVWFAKQYYNKAEDRYQIEIKAYDKKKTKKQYNILIKALEIVTVDFKKSLSYFKKIYTLQPTSKNAQYLSHIYGRLSDKKKAAYYKKISK
ncbi:MAG: hypothetical protein CL661_10995 [Bacteroidetes bacterium]|nr:hypothetical protein [Bacteroidota bacterium]